MTDARLPNDRQQENLIRRIESLLRTEVELGYDDMIAWQRRLRDAVQELIVQRVEPAFNKELQSRPHDTAADKQELCRWANVELREKLSLAIRCPKTGLPAKLHADGGKNAKNGRFQIELLGSEEGRRHTKSASKLFGVELMERPLRSEPLIEHHWTRKVHNRKHQERRDLGGPD